MNKVWVVGMCLLLFLSGCSYGKDQMASENIVVLEGKDKIILGAKFFTEQFILMKLTSIYLKEKGFDVEERMNMESLVSRSALEKGYIDLYWEYTGTALINYHHQGQTEMSPPQAYEKIKALDRELGIEWLNPAHFNNSFSLTIKQEDAEKYRIHNISDLAKEVNRHPGDFKIALTKEFYEREDGLAGLQKKYGFRFIPSNITLMDAGLTYTVLKEGQVNIALGFATDAFQYESLKEQKYLQLEDDQSYFPAYNAAPVVKQRVLQKHPELRSLLNEIANRLDTETIMKMIYLVDMKQMDISEVTRDWLKEQGLI